MIEITVITPRCYENVVIPVYGRAREINVTVTAGILEKHFAIRQNTRQVHVVQTILRDDITFVLVATGYNT